MKIVNDKKKIPIPPIKKSLYLPLEFWTEIVTLLDGKIQRYGELEAYVKVGVEISLTKGKVTLIRHLEEVSEKPAGNLDK